MHKDNVEKLIKLYEEGLDLIDWKMPYPYVDVRSLMVQINEEKVITSESIENEKSYTEFLEKREKWNTEIKDNLNSSMHFIFDFPLPLLKNEDVAHKERLKIIYKRIVSLSKNSHTEEDDLKNG